MAKHNKYLTGINAKAAYISNHMEYIVVNL
jgi:hypothetical protein